MENKDSDGSGSGSTGGNGSDGQGGNDGDDGEDGKDGNDGKCLFIKVDTSNEEYIIFTLTTGTEFKVPRYAPLDVKFTPESLVSLLGPGENIEIEYEVESESTNISVEVVTTGNLKAKVMSTGLYTGTIYITTDNEIDEEYDRVLVFVSNGQRIIMRSLSFEERGLNVNGELSYDIDAKGKELDINLTTNTNYSVLIPQEDNNWISHTATRSWRNETITLKIEENKGEVRSTEIELVDVITSKSYAKITINQEKNSDKEGCVYVNIPSGGLEDQIKDNAAEITCLTVEGHLSDEDFTFMNSSMPKLATLYMSEVDNTIMPDKCFYKNQSIIYIELPKNLTAIPNQAFDNANIQNFDLPETVTSIGDRAYYNVCNFNGDLIIPDHVISLGENAFCHTSFDGDIIIGKGIEKIPYRCFNSCDAINKIKFGENVKEIGESAFTSCTGLTGNLIIPHSVESIEEGAFMECTGLDGYIAIGRNVKKIGIEAFVVRKDDNKYHSLNVKKYIFAGTNPPSTSMSNSNGLYWSPFGLLEEMDNIPAEVPQGREYEYKKNNDSQSSVWSHFQSVKGISEEEMEKYFIDQ